MVVIEVARNGGGNGHVKRGGLFNGHVTEVVSLME